MRLVVSVFCCFHLSVHIAIHICLWAYGTDEVYMCMFVSCGHGINQNTSFLCNNWSCALYQSLVESLFSGYIHHAGKQVLKKSSPLSNDNLNGASIIAALSTVYLFCKSSVISADGGKWLTTHQAKNDD